MCLRCLGNDAHYPWEVVSLGLKHTIRYPRFPLHAVPHTVPSPKSTMKQTMMDVRDLVTAHYIRFHQRFT